MITTDLCNKALTDDQALKQLIYELDNYKGSHACVYICNNAHMSIDKYLKLVQRIRKHITNQW